MKKPTQFAGMMLIALAIPIALLGQTKSSTTRHSYLMPDDSLCYELSLEKGDGLEWNLWLSAALEPQSRTTLSLVSDVEGQLWQRNFGAEPVEMRDKTTVTRAARYRLTVKTEGSRGRLADLGVWTNLSSTARSPFPVPTVQRMAERFSSGDKYAVEYEFLLPTSTKFQELLALELPQNLVYLWAITPLGDSLPATPSVSRWVGESGMIRLRDRAPQGGRITLRLELDIADDGETALFLAPGAPPPEWLPRTARMLMLRKHDPWSAVIIPPLAVLAESLRAQPPEPPRAHYAAMSLRVRGLDSIAVSRFAAIYIERDSLAAIRYARRKAITGYDTLFLSGERAFLSPDFHMALTVPLAGQRPRKQISSRTSLSWFVESVSGQIGRAKLHEWRYDEARMALTSVPDEFFWNGEILPLRPKLQTHSFARTKEPSSIILPSPRSLRPPSFKLDGKEYLDQSRRVLGLYLENDSNDTLYFVYHQARVIQRPLFAFSRWPKGARYVAIVLGFFAFVGILALYEMRRREVRRRRRIKELEEDFEKARQVQLGLLPSGPMALKNLEVLGLHQSMQSVGGDYYDFFALEDGRVILCIADVAGHGLSAALLMSNLQATLRMVAQPGRQISEIVALLNHEISQRTSPERFVTLLLTEISADRTQVTACNAGHNPGYIIRANGGIIELDAGGLMLGVMDVFPFIQMEYGLGPGDLLVLYTDGIPEAAEGEEDMFGYERLKFFLMENRRGNLADIAQNLFRRVSPAPGQLIADDMAIVLARVTP
ncbi:MAG: PP2C family protein-serine/threonine phosphatase [bacterium]